MKWLKKELRLSTSILTPLFLLFAFMALIPNYPALVGAFFICFGIFQSYQGARENNDILYSVLLPAPKRAVVTAKYLTAMFFEALGLLLMAVCVLLRTSVLKGAAVYAASPLLPANLSYLGGALLVFALFNAVFLGGFFRTACKFGLPFIAFIVGSFLLIVAIEVLPHLPGLAFLAATEGEGFRRQLWVLLGCAAVYGLLSFLSLRRSQARFEKLDL